MKRDKILTDLKLYLQQDPVERKMVADMIAFVEQNPDCFDRSNTAGHLTGSAWIMSKDLTKTLLIHHVKLNKWLQPGGHCDGNPDCMAVALNEALEETGLAVTPLFPEIFDVDIHLIPAKGDVAAHLHYDVRYAVYAEDDGNEIGPNTEINEAQWVPLDVVHEYNDEQSIMRMVLKAKAFR